MNEPRRLRVFICHASEDNSTAGEINEKLKKYSWIDPWLDEDDLFPGQNVDLKIEEALKEADVVLICLSTKSVKKEGYVQREVNRALYYAEQRPKTTIYLIPLLLEECTPPFSLQDRFWIQYQNPSEGSFKKIMESVKIRASELGVDMGLTPMDGTKEPEIIDEPPARPPRTAFRSVVKMFLGIMLPFFACGIVAVMAVSRKYFDGIWAANKGEIIYTFIVFCALLVLSFVLFIDGLGKLTASTVKGIGQLTMAVPGITKRDVWIKRFASVRDGLKNREIFSKQVEIVRSSVTTLQNKENWFDPDFKERLKAALWSLFVPGLGLYLRGQRFACYWSFDRYHDRIYRGYRSRDSIALDHDRALQCIG
ncbi:MAG: toll/interleukin-1 receptor domain-containing protein [Anaerolineales bacterium]